MVITQQNQNKINFYETLFLVHTLYVEASGLILRANLRICNTWFLLSWFFTDNLNDVSVNSHDVCPFVIWSHFGILTYILTNFELSSHPKHNHVKMLNYLQMSKNQVNKMHTKTMVNTSHINMHTEKNNNIHLAENLKYSLLLSTNM